MLYVFHVECGQMATYDMSLTLQSVAQLKQAIERKTKIPASSLVLLVSGGEVLISDHTVSSYSAGTDTNPIYMFSKLLVNHSGINNPVYSGLSPIVEVSSGELRSDLQSMSDLRAAVEKCRSLPPAVNTVITCATLAEQFKDLAHDVSRSCEQLIHEQHLQHQGWAAVIANLEDIYKEFFKRSKNYKDTLKKHKMKRDEYYKQLMALSDVLQALEKIPILPSLQMNAEAHRFSAFDISEDSELLKQYYKIGRQLESSSEHRGQYFGVEALKFSEEEVFENKKKDTAEALEQYEESDEGVTFKARSNSEVSGKPTLLQWAMAQGNRASLEDIVDYCRKGLGLFEKDPLKELESDFCSLVDYANENSLQQIVGIEERLYGLDQLLSEVKKLERDQHDQASSLTQYRERLSSACDPSVLPTLVQSHWCQLEKLLKGHQTLVDIRRRVSNSKDELSRILKARLEAVLKIQNSMSVQDAHAMLSFQCLNRLTRYFRIVKQLHHAPLVYVRAVHEVARRKKFSDGYIKWATHIADHLLKIYEEEVARRQDFNNFFEGHFLRSLFPGLNEMPPSFGTKAPPIFDSRLPNLTDEDVKYVTEKFPELCENIPRYEMEHVVKYFNQRFNLYELGGKETGDGMEEQKDAISEAEAGGFEKVQKQTVDISTICAPDTSAVSTITEDNMDTFKMNMDRLKDFAIKLCSLCRASMLCLKEEFSDLKENLNEMNKFAKTAYLDALEALKKTTDKISDEYREKTQKMTIEHEMELSDVKEELKRKEDMIYCLRKTVVEREDENRRVLEQIDKDHQDTKNLLECMRAEMNGLELKLQESETQKQKEMKEMQDKLHQEYKAEIESLRSRFRLVTITNMDRSPSESSLERIERADVIEISSHNAIVMQTKENAEVEKEEAVKEAVARCEAEWKSKLNEMKSKYELEKQQTVLLENERILLQRQVVDLKKELENKVVETEKSKEEDSEEKSLSKKDEVKRPTRPHSHTPFGLAAGTLSLASCVPGRAVLILWDPSHNNYTVFQESNTMHFVSSGCLPPLGLSINVNNESERKLYTIGVVESKEYCFAKKNGNRFHMPCGARFYRVQVRPFRPQLPPPQCCETKHNTKQDKIQNAVLSMLGDIRAPKKWLTFMHVPEAQRSSSDASQSNTKPGEVEVGRLINLDSPESTSDATLVNEPIAGTNAPLPLELPSTESMLVSEDQLDSIGRSSDRHNPPIAMTANVASSHINRSASHVLEPEPLELTVSAMSVVARGSMPPGSELAEEASP